jgi:hypothetical protein
MMSPIHIIVNESTILTISVGDPDGDIIHCRWANSSNGVGECDDVCPPTTLPPDTIMYPNYTIIITGNNISEWYSVTLMVSIFSY